ncbi:MAG: hypothetical protein AAFR74_04635, partial [Pseudomonadota bacterium]
MPGQKTSPETSGAAMRLDMRTALLILALTLFATLAFKTVDDWRSDRAELSALTQREALAVSEYINGKVEGVSLTLSHAYRSGWGPRQTARLHPDLESVMGLADALSAPDGSRARAAGEVASQVLAAGGRAGLTDAGDIVVVYKPSNASARIGLVKADAWTPEANGSRVIALSERAALEGAPVARTTCQAVSPALYACVSHSAPFFTWVRGLELLAYALLLLSPGIVILGLWQRNVRAQSAREAIEGEATKAGRLLDIVQKETTAG